LRKTGHPDQALDYYSRALAQKPDHLDANEYLGELYLELKQPAKAQERLAVLEKACGDCEEYQELKEKIAQQAAN
jgi:tetratricopeptide (TPR) repeat protein